MPLRKPIPAGGVDNTQLQDDAVTGEKVEDGSLTADDLDMETIELGELGEKDHSSLESVTSDQHHAKVHAHDGADGSGTVAHSDITGQTPSDHHLVMELIADDDQDGQLTGTHTSFGAGNNPVCQIIETLPAGDYLVEADVQLSGEDTGTSFEAELEVDSTQEDVTAFVPSVKASEGCYPKQPLSSKILTLTAASHTINLNYRSTTAGKEARVKNARLRLWRVA